MNKQQHIKESLKIYHKTGYSEIESRKMANRDWKAYQKHVQFLGKNHRG